MLSVEFIDNQLKILDQRVLPLREEHVFLKSAESVASAIKSMAVRGAPAIGIAAAYGLALSENPKADHKLLLSTRPTAIDLKNALDFVAKGKSKSERTKLAIEWQRLVSGACRRIAENGAGLLRNCKNILTHCNTGAVATGVEYGTALGVIKRLKEEGADFFVYVGETRPRFQGAITSWELHKIGVRHAVFVDSAAGYLISSGKVDAIIVGADRVATNGDFANKIGTYSLATIAKTNNVPFYVAAPMSSFDFSIKSGKEIVVEMRSEDEVLEAFGKRIYPAKTSALNPAFDITPGSLVTAFITEKGIFKPWEVGELGRRVQRC
ncbi:MAG: S-methyl-5-thioribose-1-phosphate isomerase [Candidatus Bilamarchaeaceae archaeon]